MGTENHHSPQIQLDSYIIGNKERVAIRCTLKDKAMIKRFRRPLSIALASLATSALGGCYYGDVYGSSYASAGSLCGDRYYDYDPYAYDDGYGYNCYDGSDYGSGFVQIGFGGGWYDDYYYPGYGTWMFDNYRNRYPLRGQYLNYWGGRRAWWKHHQGRPGNGHWNRPGRGDGDGRPGRPGGWNRGDRDNDGPRGTRPPRPGTGAGAPPGTTNPVYQGRPGRGDSIRPGRPGGGRPDGARPSRPAPSAVAPAPRPAPSARPAPPPRPAPSMPRGRDDRANHTKPQ